MASSFECEVRFTIKDIKVFKRRLRELKARLLYPYAFTDYYYHPVNEKWNPLQKNLRIREWQKPKRPSTIYFVKNEIVKIGGIKFKRALYPEGKTPLFAGSTEACKSILIDLGFKPWVTVKKEKALFWNVHRYGFKTIAEYVKGLGWTGELEFEGKNPKRAMTEIKKALSILGIQPELVSFKPISVLFAEKIDLRRIK